MDEDLPSLPSRPRPHLHGIAQARDRPGLPIADTPAPVSPVARGDAFVARFATSHAGVIAFLAVATEGSFAKAGDRLGIGRSAVSRSVQKLEAQLDARLFLRTTRRTSLTREGELFYENCRPGVDRIVQALEDMRELRSGPPRGHLRVCATAGFGRAVVAPLLRGFQDRYPEISLELLLDDAPPDFASDRVDVSFRDGPMADSQVIAQRLMPMQLRLCASPAYAERHGLPRGLDDLAGHRCIAFRQAGGRVREWEFEAGGQPRKLSPPGAMLTFNDEDLVLQAVLDGQGIAQVAGHQACGPLRAGRLLACLPQHAPEDRGHCLCYLSRQHLPARIRVFVDHMAARIRGLDLSCDVPGAEPVAA